MNCCCCGSIITEFPRECQMCHQVYCESCVMDNFPAEPNVCAGCQHEEFQIYESEDY